MSMTARATKAFAVVLLVCATGGAGFYVGRSGVPRAQSNTPPMRAESTFRANLLSANASVLALSALHRGNTQAAMEYLESVLDLQILGLSPTYSLPHLDTDTVECQLAFLRQYRTEHPSMSTHDQHYAMEQRILSGFPILSGGSKDGLPCTWKKL